MFNDIGENIKKIEGAYRKLKSYYYYNKKNVLIRKKIAEFECDSVQMESKIKEIAEAICNPESKKEYLNGLLESISFYVIPKRFDAKPLNATAPVSNTIQHDKNIKTVNFFIDAPIEIHIIDTLWTILLAKMENDLKVLSFDVYGNTINKSSLFDINGNIKYENGFLFNNYFNYYTMWKNESFKAIEENYNTHKDSILITLDIKSYYYSIKFRFDILQEIFKDSSLLEKIKPLTLFMERVYESYYNTINPLRKDLQNKSGEYPLPIGLFSSMVLGNLYLSKFDSNVRKIKNLNYYGRYVDDLLFVINKTISQDEENTSILDDVFVKTGILEVAEKKYTLCEYKDLYVQMDKIKILYIDSNGSRTLLDLYDKKICLIPSQMDPLPFENNNLADFDDVAYNIENCKEGSKIRDIGLFQIDSFNVSRFFSSLPRYYAHMETNDTVTKEKINSDILQIERLFLGSQIIEYYSTWLNYMYFLVITNNADKLEDFKSKATMQIQKLSSSLEENMFNNVDDINKRAKESLLEILNISLDISLALNINLAKKHFEKEVELVKKYINANIFEHIFVSFPLANYLDYEKDVSYCTMNLDELGKYPKNIEDAFKFKWSPRFIHYDELSLLLFYYYHKNNKNTKSFDYVKEELILKYKEINHLGYKPIKIQQDKIYDDKNYSLNRINIAHGVAIPQNVYIAIGSIDITQEKIYQGFERWSNLTKKDKDDFYKILQDTWSFFKGKKEENIMILVMPELCYPIYWINELISFAKKTNIGIVTGLQYVGDDTTQKYNYLLSVLPFKTGKKHYKNAFVNIREKNDYSPIEKEFLAKVGAICRDREKAEYLVFNWRGIKLSTMVCFELTDIMARAILKGKVDIITASVYNPDTTYFSNIIESSVRDLHSFVVQANTSHFGDSRVTGPYDRNHKDLIKIKGGENDHVVICSIDFKEYKDFQANYYVMQKNRLQTIPKEEEEKVESKKEIKADDKDKKGIKADDKDKKEIKPFSARFSRD